MPQADNVVTFPLGASTTDLMTDLIGSPQHKLSVIAERLIGLEAMVYLMKTADVQDSPHSVANALFGIEVALQDCIAIADLKPLETAR